ncbi:MAG: hypothetical protein ACK58T_13505, partial [Phycisphaerae bacterium]
EAALRAIPGVAGLQTAAGDAEWVSLVVESTDPTGIRAAIGQSLVRAAIACRSLQAEAPSLEQVFTKLLEQSRTEAAA